MQVFLNFVSQRHTTASCTTHHTHCALQPAWALRCYHLLCSPGWLAARLFLTTSPLESPCCSPGAWSRAARAHRGPVAGHGPCRGGAGHRGPRHAILPVPGRPVRRPAPAARVRAPRQLAGDRCAVGRGCCRGASLLRRSLCFVACLCALQLHRWVWLLPSSCCLILVRLACLFVCFIASQYTR